MDKYDFEMNMEPGTTPVLIMEQIAPGSDILEFGCANGRMTKYLKEQKNCKVSIIELEKAPFSQAVNYAADGICTDIEKDEWTRYFAGKQFDYIIFADVLEHLRTAEKTLKNAKSFLKDDGKVIISIPNIAHNDVIAQLFNNSFEYQKIGLLDNTHIHFWGEKELKTLAENTGYFLEILDGSYHGPFMTELKDMAENVPEALKAILRNREYNEVYQFFLILRKKEWANENGLETDVRLKKFGSQNSAAFYWDSGNGYKPELLSLVPCTEIQGTRVFCVENIPENCKKVRFDPPASGAFFVENCRVIINDSEECTILPLNGLTVDHNTCLFHGVHAQMEISLPDNASRITVMIRITPCSEKDAEYIESQLAEKVKYQNELIEHNHKIDVLTEENNNFRLFNQRLTEESNNLHAHNQRLNEENDKLHARTKQLTDEKESIERMFQEKRQEHQLLLDDYNSLNTLLKDLQNTQEGLLNDHRNLSMQYESVLAQYMAVLDSQFWKITAPFRKIIDKIKSTRLGGLFHKAMYHYRAFGFKLTIKKAVQKVAQKIKSKLRKRDFDKADSQHSGSPVIHLRDIAPTFESLGASVFGKEAICKMKKGRRILIISHELNLTGAPVAIESMSKCFREMGKDVLIISPHDGNLRDRFTSAGTPVIVFDMVYQSDMVKRIALLFDLIVVSTNVGAPVIAQLSGMSVPVMWWIHEARASYSDEAVNAMPEHLGGNIHVYCGGAYAQNLLKEYRPGYASELFLYCTPDHTLSDVQEGNLDLSTTEGKTVFALVGMLEHRKGQDILAEAIRKLPEEKRKNCYFFIVGRQCYPPNYTAVMDLCRDFPDNVRYIEELKREDLTLLYNRMDCLLCVSRDDPMPVVVTDALSLSKCVICSENTGSASLLLDMGSGIIYRNNSPRELAGCIEAFLDGLQELPVMCSRARETYQRYFTEETFKNNLTRILNKIAPDKTSPDFKSFDNIFNMYQPAPGSLLREVYGQDIIRNYENNNKKNILLLSHELSLTGAPVVLHKMAVVFRKQGHNVTVLSPFDGPLREKFTEEGFPVILFEDIYDPASNDFLSVYGAKFDFIVMNTVVTYRAIPKFEGLSVPVIWWIHDSHASYTYGGFGKCLPAVIPENITILCGGSYARKQLLSYYPHYQAGELLYAINDCAQNTKGTAPELNAENKKVFLIVGTVERRKGQDIAVAAIRKIPKDVLKQCQFIFLGKEIEPPVMKAIESLCHDMPEYVRLMGPIPLDDLIALYRSATCLICSSRDDPMPVVVTEMQALSKPVICSENTGNAELIKRYGGGLIYTNNDASELATQICKIAKSSEDELADLGKEGRKLYENCFSEQNFEQELTNLLKSESSIDRKCAMTTVSVVIPTYNAGENFREMLSRLNAQRGIAKIEILVVDSGSSDATQKIAVESGAKLIQISQEEFSHSYARNLGADNATGHILLFMTQDAMPSDEDWVKQMIIPILSKECSAVSCREQCPEGTDLYYKVASWYHARYLGIDKESKIGKFVPDMAAEELRKNSALNDVSTAIDRNVFHQLGGYRHSFAEDLDMGIRILNAGKSIKLLHTPTVIHGHTRASSYYLRRGFAEGRALEKIVGIKEADISAKTLADMIVTGYGVLQKTFVQIMSETGINSISDFDKRLHQLIQEQSANPPKAEYGQKLSDAYVESYVQKIDDLQLTKSENNLDLVHMIMHYWTNVLQPCLKETRWANENLPEQICGCLYKQMSLVMGNVIAHIAPEEPCYQEFKKLADGV